MSVLSSDRWTTLCVVFFRHNNIKYYLSVAIIPSVARKILRVYRGSNLVICDSVTFSGFQSEKDLELNQIIAFFMPSPILNHYCLWIPVYILYVCRLGVARVGRVVWPARAAESKGRQNEYFKLKKKMFALNKFLDY